MALNDVWIKTVATHRGSPRIYLDGLQAIRAGFSPGEKFEVDVDGTKVIISKNVDGSRVVSKRKKGDREIPVIDINSAELLAAFEGMDCVRVVVGEDRVYLLPLASEQRKVERLTRLRGKIANGEPLAAGSLAHGGGVLAHAVHTGLRDAGIECDLKFANEIRDDLMLQALEHNSTWNEETAALAVPLQEMAQDEWLLSRLPKLEVLEMGLPCSGASLAGHTKNKLTKMEDHEEVGHLVYSALVMISKTNPAVVLLENVPLYAKSASAQILRHQFRDMAYDTHEAVLSGSDFGCLEARVRWCMVAVTRGMKFDFESIAPPVRAVRTVSEYIDPNVREDDPRWTRALHLKKKQDRNQAEGNGFRMQFVSPEDTSVPTIRKFYNKGGSTDPRLVHPTDPELSRLFNAGEVADMKGIPREVIEGLSQTTAIELLGQSIIYEPFRAAGERVGESILRLADDVSLLEDDSDESSEVARRRQRTTG